MSADEAGNRAPVSLVLFGAPGSGKGTQAKMLSGELGVPHISTGDMLREHIETGDSIGREISNLLRSGGLVPDAMVNLLVERRLAQPDCAKGFILDGYPRTRQQAEKVFGWMDGRGIREVVIHLIVDYNKIIARLTSRRQCFSCGALYNLVTQPPRVEGICDRCGDSVGSRDDDTEPVIRRRLEAYEAQTRPVLDYFVETGRTLVEIDASESAPAEVMSEIRRRMAA